MRDTMSSFFPTALKILAISTFALNLQLIGPSQARAQTVDEQDAQLLTAGQPIKRNISCGEYQYYRIMLVSDQYLRLVVDQRGVDVSVKLYQPDGKVVAESNRMIGAYGPETIAWVADSSGSYKLEVRSATTDQVGAHYEVKILEERTATFQDKNRIPAQDVFMQAEQLREQRTASSLDEAIGKYEEALRMWKAIGNPSGQAETLNVLGLIFHLMKSDPAKARQHYEKALEISRAAGERRSEAESLNNLARVYEKLGERQNALDYDNLSLQRWLDVGDRYGEAWAFFNLARDHYFLSDAPKALDHYNRALTLWGDLKDLSRQASTLNGIGDTYYLISEYGSARSNYEQALTKWQDARDSNGEVSTLFSISRTYGKLDDRKNEDKFRRLAEQKRAQIRRACVRPSDNQTKSDNVQKAEDAREEARVLLLQNTETSQRKAIEKNEEAVRLFDSARDYHREVATLFYISSIYRTLDENKNERRTLDRANDLAERVGKPSLRAEVMQRFAAFHSAYDDQLKAVDYYDRAIELWRRQRDRRSEANVLSITAKIYDDKLDEKKKAIDYLEQALALYQQLEDRFREAYMLNDLAALYLKTEQKQKALDYFKRTLNLRRQKGDRAGEANTLKEIAAVYLAMGKRDEALNYYYQTLELYRMVRDRMGQAETLRGLMAYWKEPNPAVAIFYGKQAVNTYQEVRENIQGLEKETQTSFLKSKEDFYRELADLLIFLGRLPEAQQVLDMLKEEEFTNFIRTRRLKSSVTERVTLSPKEEDQYKQYRDFTDRATAISREYDELMAKPVRNAEESKRSDELLAQIKTLNGKFLEYLDFLQEALKLSDEVETIKEHQKLRGLLRELGQGSVALYTLLVKDKYRVVLYTPRLDVARMYSIKEEDLNYKIMAFRQALKDPQSDPLPLAKEIYQIVIGPIAKDLEGINAKTLMWHLDGGLRYLPIAALHDGEKYLVERYRNETFFGTSDTQLGAPSAPSWRGLGFGVSTLPKDSTFSKDFPPLPAVVEELNGIFRNEDDPNATGGTLPGKIIRDDKFTKDAMIKALQLEQYNLVHIASHFKFDLGKDGKASYLVLGNGTPLTGDEISKLPTIFYGVDLLTLSACNTAMDSGGNGKEVDGFPGLAQRQGAKAVIASLWSVADASTGLLMQKFYQVRVRTTPPASKAESLQEAQLALLRKEVKSSDPNAKDYSHPYFWAPFILIGNWR